MNVTAFSCVSFSSIFQIFYEEDILLGTNIRVFNYLIKCHNSLIPVSVEAAIRTGTV